MAAFGKAPRKQKGAMAYDGPNKRRSEAADRVLAKLKARKAKMQESVEKVNPDANVKKVDVMKGKNKVVVNPKISEAYGENGMEEKGAQQKAKQAEQMKKRVLMAKIKAVRAGAGESIMASHEPKGESIEESEKTAAKAYEIGKKLGAKRRQASYKKYGANVGSPGKNERAAYKLASSARSRDASLETQSTKKKSPAGADTSQIGHYKKRDEKTSVGKKGGKLKTPKYKLSFSQRVDHHSNKSMSRRDPKQNPKHTANEDYHAGTGEKVVARTKKFMDKKGMKGAPGLDAMKARTAEHKAKRGVKEDINPFVQSSLEALSSIVKKKSNLGEEGYDIARDQGRVRPSKDKKDGTSYPPSEEMKKTQKVNTGPSAAEIVKKKYGKAVMDMGKK
jgi:hypothetical protein